MMLEREPMNKAVQDGELMAYFHDDFGMYGYSREIRIFLRGYGYLDLRHGLYIE